jgi:hypothetical protein
MSEEQLNASLDAEGAKLVEEGAEDVELTDEELAGAAGGIRVREAVGGVPWDNTVGVPLIGGPFPCGSCIP